MTPELIKKLKAARTCSTPLIAFETSEPASACRAITAAVNGTAPCKAVWDCIRGVVPLDDASAGVLKLAQAALNGEDADTAANYNASEFSEILNALELLPRLPDYSLLIAHNFHRLFQGSPTQSYIVMQAVWNLRDVLKSTGTTLVMLAPSHSLPVELSQDVTLLREPLPTDAVLSDIVSEVYLASEVEAPGEELLRSSQAALRGLNPFAAEQAAAESMTRSGLDITALWERKKAVIEQTKGASFYTTGLKYADVGGAETVKRYFSSLFSGPNRPELVLMFDELDKSMAGSDAGGDNGVGRDMLQVVLSEMQGNDYPGAIFAGHPGTGKTVLTEAIAMEHGVPLLKADLNAVKGSLMGESEQGIREFFRMVKGLTGGAKGGKALFIGCVNKMHESIPPELRRRFTRRGVWFFDLPTPEELEAIWHITLQRFGMDCQPDNFPDDTNWTGADIYNCVETAHALRITLTEAARYLVPVAVSDPKAIHTLREAANNRWLSVSHDGPYRMAQNSPAVPLSSSALTATSGSGQRRMKVGE